MVALEAGIMPLHDFVTDVGCSKRPAAAGGSQAIKCAVEHADCFSSDT